MSLLEFFDNEFLAGKDHNAGAKLLSAMGFFRPSLRNLRQSGLLPRVRLALQGWSRVAPGVPRLPLPWPVLSGLCAVLISMDCRASALACFTAADAYLRPGELLWLSSEDVAHAQPALGKPFSTAALRLFPEDRGRPSKTRVFSDSVVLDSEGREWLSRAVQDLAQERPGLQLFPLTYLQWLGDLKTASAALGLHGWDITLYVLRHTGPAHDFLAHLRTLPEIQRRGRWALETSVRRYERSSRVASQLNRLSAVQLAFCRLADRLLPDLFAGKAAVPPLPVAVRRRQKT